MAIPPVDFLDKDADIKFQEINAGVAFTLQVRVNPRQGDRRPIPLTPHAGAEERGIDLDKGAAVYLRRSSRRSR